MLLGVDVGGTFTDAALLDGERLHTAKVPSTPDDQSRGVIAAVDERAAAGPPPGVSQPDPRRRTPAPPREALPGLHVSASHDVLPPFRDYARCAATAIDASRSPRLGRYLTSLAGASTDRGLT